MLVLGLSMGILIPVLVLVIQNAVHPRDLGVATSSVQVFRQLGGSTGIAVFGALSNARLATTLATELPADSPVSGLDVSELVSSPAVVAAMEAPLRDAIREAVALSSSQMFRLAIPIAVGGRHRCPHAERASPSRRSPPPADGSHSIFGGCAGRAHPALRRGALRVDGRRMTALSPEEGAGSIGSQSGHPGTGRVSALSIRLARLLRPASML